MPIASSELQISLVPNPDKWEIKREPRKLGVVLQNVKSLASLLFSLYILKSFYDCSIISKVFSRFRREEKVKVSIYFLVPEPTTVS